LKKIPRITRQMAERPFLINMLFEKENEKNFTKNAVLHRNILEYLFEKQGHKPFRFTELAKFLMRKNYEFKDIQGSVDIYDRRRNIPLEFKTTRASDIREPKSFHVEQLKYYMSILSAEEGYMLYQLLMHFGQTPFKTFRITMSAEERKAQRDKLVKEIDSLKKAMEAGNPSLARSVDKDPSLNWLCKDCPYLMKCQEIQRGATAAA
jgi:CRISPR/Cas system-associated exonuclease Cas4 (RecB family)